MAKNMVLRRLRQLASNTAVQEGACLSFGKQHACIIRGLITEYWTNACGVVIHVGHVKAPIRVSRSLRSSQPRKTGRSGIGYRGLARSRRAPPRFEV
jgi:hypothetical protein